MTIQQVILDNKQVRIALSGSIYVQDAAEIREKLNGLIDKGYTKILIDLSAVDYIDSSGIGTLIALHKRAHVRHGSVTIKGLNGLVKELFKLTHVDKVLEIE